MIRTLVKVVVAVALLVLASLVFTLAPSDEQNQAPVEIPVAIGETGVGRNIEVTVQRLRLAEVAEADGYSPWTGTTPGVWLVVEATMSNVVNSTLPSASLSINGVTYDASTRPGSESLTGMVLSPGIPTTGSVLFEIPRDLITSAEPVKLTFTASHDVRLDSAIVLTVRLDDLEVEPVYALTSPETGRP
ncbi:MAG: hypothetical protein ACOH19_04110 [Rhodoglobus sp.]